MKWADPYDRANQLARSAILNWDSWTIGARRGWCHEVGKLPKKYRKLTWISISVNSGWRRAKEIREFFHSVVGETSGADPAAFEQDPAIGEREIGGARDE